MTNADKIRAMSDSDLAEFISDITDECERKTECNASCGGCDELYCEYTSCINWLRMEVSE